MTNQKAKDYLKKQYPKFQAFIEHTMVAEMALNLAKEYHKKQLLIHSVVGQSEQLICPICGLDGFENQADLDIHLEDCED